MQTKLVELMKQASVVGAGGAGFPSYAKIADGADTLVVNAAECEPLTYTDLTLMRHHMPEIIRGVEIVLSETGMERGIVGMKTHTGKELGYTDGQVLGKNVTVCLLPDVYPMGDEISLIYETTGRLVQPGALPITQHVIVYNAETVYNIYRAVTEGAPVTEKWLSIGGDLKQGYIVRVPIGMRISELFEKLGITIPEGHVLIDGGPSMGKIIPLSGSVIRKTTKGLLILPDTIPAVVNQNRSPDEQRKIASSVCCQCSRCTELCPRHMLGYPIEPHRMVRSSVSIAKDDPILIQTAQVCCSCGICSVAACCQGISPRAVINEYKGILAKNRVRFNANGKIYHPHPDRENRMMSSERWKELLGVKRFDKEGKFLPDLMKAGEVVIPMSMHIGAPSVPAVSVGDHVTAGQMIAGAAEGALSVPQYASVTGKVSFADAKQIIIQAD